MVVVFSKVAVHHLEILFLFDLHCLEGFLKSIFTHGYRVLTGVNSPGNDCTFCQGECGDTGETKFFLTKSMPSWQKW